MLTHEALVLSAILVPADYLVTTSDGSTRTWHEPVGFGVLAAGSRLLTQLN